VAARSKAWVCDRLLPGIAGSNLAGGAWMSVFFECCMLPGRSLCAGPINRPEDSYRVKCVCELDHETSIMRRPRTTRSRRAIKQT
jgi:hypothetical protein